MDLLTLLQFGGGGDVLANTIAAAGLAATLLAANPTPTAAQPAMERTVVAAANTKTKVDATSVPATSVQAAPRADRPLTSTEIQAANRNIIQVFPAVLNDQSCGVIGWVTFEGLYSGSPTDPVYLQHSKELEALGVASISTSIPAISGLYTNRVYMEYSGKATTNTPTMVILSNGAGTAFTQIWAYHMKQAVSAARQGLGAEIKTTEGEIALAKSKNPNRTSDYLEQRLNEANLKLNALNGFEQGIKIVDKATEAGVVDIYNAAMRAALDPKNLKDCEDKN